VGASSTRPVPTLCPSASRPPFFAVCLAIGVSPVVARAGVLLPDPVSFDATDLAKALSAAPAPQSTAAPETSSKWPDHNGEPSPDPTSGLKGNLPTGSNSSNGSSSSSTSSGGAGVSDCNLSCSVIIAADDLLFRIVADFGLDVPDPPGTVRLRPPRNG
jgi:hypothetical protein